MWAVLALSATVLTSILPILNKLLLRDARPALVAWAINAASLPLLAMGTLFFTECTIETDRLSLLLSALAAHRCCVCCCAPWFSSTQLGG